MYRYYVGVCQCLRMLLWWFIYWSPWFGSWLLRPWRLLLHPHTNWCVVVGRSLSYIWTKLNAKLVYVNALLSTYVPRHFIPSESFILTSSISLNNRENLRERLAVSSGNHRFGSDLTPSSRDRNATNPDKSQTHANSQNTVLVTQEVWTDAKKLEEVWWRRAFYFYSVDRLERCTSA